MQDMNSTMEESPENGQLTADITPIVNDTDTTMVTANNSTSVTTNSSWELQEDMRFTNTHVMVIVVLSILMIISTFGNTLVLCALHRKQRKRHSRVNVMLFHLAIADLMVTLIMMPLEIGWAWTVQWRAGDIMCRIMMFFRVFGLYLSSFVLVCISIDRYFAVMQPLRISGADRRVKVMLGIAWAASVFCSVPQTVVFHLGEHPEHKSYFQCVTLNYVLSESAELAYNIFVFLGMFGLPLIVIVATYSAIIMEISTQSRECDVVSPRRRTCNGDVRLRRSGTVTLHRARTKILRLTFIVVAVFILCWTPYNVICVMFWVDREATQATVPFYVQKALFLFAASNSCMNPIVYGIFMINCTSFVRSARPTVRSVQQSQSAGTSTTTASDHSFNQITQKKPSMNLVMRSLNRTTKDWTRSNTFKTRPHIALI